MEETENTARASSSSHYTNFNSKVETLEAMGFSEEHSLSAVQRCGSSSTLERLVDFMVNSKPSEAEEAENTEAIIKSMRVMDVGESSSASSSHSTRTDLKIQELKGMGFPREMYILAIRRCGSFSTLDTLVDFMVESKNSSVETVGILYPSLQHFQLSVSQYEVDEGIQYPPERLMENLQQLTSCSFETARQAFHAYGYNPELDDIDEKTALMMDYIVASDLDTGDVNNEAASEDLMVGEEDSVISEADSDLYDPQPLKPIPQNKKRKVRPSSERKAAPASKRAVAATPQQSFRCGRDLTGFGVPGHPSIARALDEGCSGPPYFYFENVASMPAGEWQNISRHLYDIAPEFTDSKYFSACRRPRGYVHKLPTTGRIECLPKPPLTIHELVPDSKLIWPSWDPRTQLNCILPRMATEARYSKIHELMVPWSKQTPPPEIQSKIVKLAREYNLIWIRPGGIGRLEINEAEQAMGFDRDHTRSLCSTHERFSLLGKAFQVNTVAYHLSVLRPLYPEGMNVLSLFAGIGGAEVALHKIGIPLNLVVSVECNERARRVLAHWWESSQQRGMLIEYYTNVQQLTKSELQKLLEGFGGFDLVIGGSPCTNLSGLNRHHRDGLAGDDSVLFFEFPRIVTQVREFMLKKRR